MKSLIVLAMMVQVSPGSIPKQKLVTADGQEVKCKLVQEVHSRVPTRVCRTKASWAKIEKENEEAMRQAGKNTAECQPGVPC